MKDTEGLVEEVKHALSLGRITDSNRELPGYLTVSTAAAPLLPPPTSDTLPLAALCMMVTNKA